MREQQGPKKPSLHLCSLPFEIRRMIYALLFSPQSVLRAVPELKATNPQKDGAPQHNELANISLLLVCHQISKEAFTAFYSRQTFHYAIPLSNAFTFSPSDGRRHLCSIPPHIDSKLPFLHHVSLSYSARYRDLYKPSLADELIAQHIEYCTQHASNIRTLTIHLLIVQDDERAFEDVFSHGSTTRVLKRLHPALDRLSVVLCGPATALSYLHFGVPEFGETLRQWPMLSISQWDQECVETRMRSRMAEMGRRERIRAWHFYSGKISEWLSADGGADENWGFGNERRIGA